MRATILAVVPHLELMAGKACPFPFCLIDIKVQNSETRTLSKLRVFLRLVCNILLLLESPPNSVCSNIVTVPGFPYFLIQVT